MNPPVVMLKILCDGIGWGARGESL